MTVKLGDIAFENRENWTGSTEGVPIVGLEHLTPGEIKLQDWTSDLKESTFTKKFRKGQVLLGRRRVYLRKAALAPFDGICSGDITVIESDPAKLLPELLPFIIQNDEFFDYAMKGSAGSLSPRVKWAYLANYTFNLPSLLEQRRQADLLWAANDLKESYKRLLAVSDEMAKSRFDEMFGDGFLEQNKHRIVKLKDISIKISDGVHAKPEYTASGKPFLSVVNIVKGFVDFTDCKFVSEVAYRKMISSTHPEKGDVLYTKVGATYGVPAYVDTDQDFCLYVSVCLIKPNHQKVDSRFLAFSMKMPYVKHQADTRIKGIGVPDLHLNQIREFDIILPPMEQQREFVAFIEQLDKSKVALQKGITALDDTIKTILHKTFFNEEEKNNV